MAMTCDAAARGGKTWAGLAMAAAMLAAPALSGCGGDDSDATASAMEPLTVQMEELPAGLGVMSDGLAMRREVTQFAFSADVDTGGSTGTRWRGSLLLKGVDDFEATALDGLLLGDCNAGTEQPSGADTLTAAMQVRRAGLRRALLGVTEELQQALAPTRTVSAQVIGFQVFRRDFEQAVQQHRRELADLQAQNCAAEALAAAGNATVQGRREADGRLGLQLTRADGTVWNFTGQVDAQGVLSGRFIGPGAVDVGAWSAVPTAMPAQPR